MGESGSGKSTLAQMVLRLQTPTAGRVLFDGVDVTGFGRKEQFAFRRRVQPIFQNPYGSLDPTYSIYRTIEEPLRLHSVGDKKAREATVREMLDRVSLPSSVMRRYPNELSGGQRQRIAIARALALRPDVVVCDEAVSALDVLVQAQILDLLSELQAELGLTYLFITHDLAVVRQIADRVCVMQDGKLVEEADTDAVFDHPQQEYTRTLLNAIPGAGLITSGEGKPVTACSSFVRLPPQGGTPDPVFHRAEVSVGRFLLKRLANYAVLVVVATTMAYYDRVARAASACPVRGPQPAAAAGRRRGAAERSTG